MSDTYQDVTADAAHLARARSQGEPARAFLALSGEPGCASRLVDVADGEEITFGRSRSATVVVVHEQVSRLHTRLRRDGGQVTVEDLGSRNGTRVNGERISVATVLTPGDAVAFGPVTAVYGRATRPRPSVQVADVGVFDERLAAELDRARRYGRPFAVAMARVTGGDTAVDRLARAARRMDLVAEFGGDELALVLPELDRDEARRELTRLAAEVAAAGGAMAAGLAIGPACGTTPDRLVSVARAALRVAGDGQPAAEPAPGADRDDDILAVDPAMRRLYQVVARIAATPLTVLIYGETGVGKELVAEALHRASPRCARPLVKLNCASLPAPLLESALFGHERGAFTGAERRAHGYFEAASGGSLFLDELGEMPAALQAKLLRVLERRVVTRVGGTTEIPVDVRVIAATNRDLEAEVHDGRFREDLYFRIAGFTLVVPPLRDRPTEIVPLAERFATRFAAELGVARPHLSQEACAALLGHDWPGNVRELKNAIDRALVLATGGSITAVDLPERIADTCRRGRLVDVRGGVRDQLASVERAAMIAALEACGGNQTRAARQLGMSRRAFIYKVKRYRLKGLSLGTGE